ncbi:hypothetical protein G3480_26360 [Thiorhodococcus mannitoliphagus]|uniref:Uncharacterized protein n=1 Tax=Thiorhodococcus mannitoliphagus TaxID=329406 RepID=A0A6P1DZW7_9GAMM|nr:hypothetical protein [Thiorhodococcus mannitoliphagus]NEX23748.1 hypothetical protein [Thiorhodococcus mannitoliphagus]
MNIEEIQFHWRYFLSLERDVEILKNYIEICDQNYSIHSMELFKILQLACAEIDSALRVLCKEIDPATNYHDETIFSGRISDYKVTVYSRFPNIHKAEILVPGFPAPLKPWDEWQTVNSPDWWVGYNRAKHYRHSCYCSANLKNMLMAMSALMVVILYLYRLVANSTKANPSPAPKFFYSEYTSLNLVCAPNNELPDF